MASRNGTKSFENLKEALAPGPLRYASAASACKIGCSAARIWSVSSAR